MNRLVVCTVGLLLAPAAFAAQCVGREGVTANLEWNVEWTRNGPSTPGETERWNVTQGMGPESTYVAEVDVVRSENSLRAIKVNAPNKNNCTYDGQVNGNIVEGSYQCPQGTRRGTPRFRFECSWD